MKPTYFADFETTQPNNNNEVSVYLWCMVGEGEEYSGTSIESFIELIENMDALIYFHNLKFDFSYIQYYLLKNQREHKVLEKQGIIYNISFNNVIIRDSLNFLPMTLKEIGDKYCSKYKKTSIDYNVYEGHQATEEEIEYCFNDCKVLEEGLNNYFNSIEEILERAGCFTTLKNFRKRMTNAGIAYDAFKEISGFKKLCPKTTHNDYELMRPAYKGGFVYSNDRGIQTNVQMIDNNSMYPYQYSSIEMPYGRPINCKSFEDISRFKFYVVGIKIKYELKEGYIPIIGGAVGKYGGINYKASSNGEWEDLVVCNTDLELIKEFYETDIYFIWGKGFETQKGMFKEYADIFIAFKNEFHDIRRYVAKVFLNSPYGKTAMNGLQEIKRFYIDEKENVVKSEVIGYELDDMAYQYLPIAIAITAGARKLLLTTARNIGFKNVLYMDTDSIKYNNVPVPFEFDPDTLGAWKDEGKCKFFKTIAPKKYCYYKEGILSFTCAGFNKRVLHDEMMHMRGVSKRNARRLINKFKSGLELECLQSKVVTGGRALIPVLKQIK